MHSIQMHTVTDQFDLLENHIKAYIYVHIQIHKRKVANDGSTREQTKEQFSLTHTRLLLLYLISLSFSF